MARKAVAALAFCGQCSTSLPPMLDEPVAVLRRSRLLYIDDDRWHWR